MTAQLPLNVVPDAGAITIGAAAALVEDHSGGRVFLHGELCFAWDAGDETSRRLAAVQLVRIKAARAGEVAAGFGVDPETLRRWARTASGRGAAALARAKPGPKGPSVLTPQVVADIRARREGGASLRVIADAVGVSTASVRRALKPVAEPSATTPDLDGGLSSEPVPGEASEAAVEDQNTAATGAELPVLPAAADRAGERAAARTGLLEHAAPVFVPAARVPLAGLLLALPALEATGLLACARGTYGSLQAGFYGLDTMLLEGVLRALAGESRAEGATRIDPVALGRVLGLDRSPEVKTIRRKIAQLAGQGRAADLLAGIAKHHLAGKDDAGKDHAGKDHDDDQVGLVLYVDGHVRAYQGTRKVAKTHASRLRFPAPATVETWVSDADGDPVLVVMAEPGASLAMELRRLLPDLRAAVGDDRRVLVGFDRGGWSPALFAHMHAAGFDVLTWRKGPTGDIDPDLFTDVTHVDQAGRAHTWKVADTMVDLPLGSERDRHDGAVLTMRQVTRLDEKKGTARQVHVLTTRTDLPAGQVLYRMGSRWRQENYFRYARMHFDFDSHDAYTTSADDPDRLVPNPAKKRAHAAVLAARSRYERALAATDAALLQARSPAPGHDAVISNADHDALTAGMRAAAADLDTAQTAHKQAPARVRLGQAHPGQQVLDTETKLIHHGIRMAAFNTATAIARDIRINTGYARANHEAHALTRQVLTHTGDIDPSNGVLTVRLDPMPTARATAAITELCQHLTATQTTYPGTDLTLRYEIKNRP